MESRIKLFGHALHPILIVFPLGLLATAVIFDVVYLVADDSAMAIVAYWMIVAGVIGGFAAAFDDERRGPMSSEWKNKAYKTTIANVAPAVDLHAVSPGGNRRDIGCNPHDYL